MVLEFKVTLEEKENDKTYEFDIVIPEFVHDQPEDEYEFQINGSDLEYKKYVRNGLVPLVKTKLIKFQPDLINEFDPQIKHNTDWSLFAWFIYMYRGMKMRYIFTYTW